MWNHKPSGRAEGGGGETRTPLLPDPGVSGGGGNGGDRTRASVALKAGTSTRGIAGGPQEIIDTAVMYLAWLKTA